MHFRSISIAVAVSCLTAVPAWADETEDRVKEIRAWYAEIEAASKKGEEIKFEAQDEPLSGTLTHFRKDGKLIKSVLSYTDGDHGGADERFYFHDGRLVFIHVTNSSWRFTGETLPNGQSETMDEVTEFRIYLHDGKVIRNLTKTAIVKSGQDMAKALKDAENKPTQEKEHEQAVLERAGKVGALKDGASVMKLFGR